MSAWTNDDVKEYIKRSFGHPVVDFELSPDHLEDCLTDAFLWFNDRRGLRALTVLTLVLGRNEYDLSTVDPPVVDVLRVSFERQIDVDLRAIYGDDLSLPGVPWGMFPYGALQGGTYSALVQALQYRKTAAKIMSADVDWEQIKKIDPLDPDRRVKPYISIYPGDSSVTGPVIIEYKALLENFRQLELDPRYFDFVLRRAIIAAKEKLGRIRGKYGSLPTARGDRSLDGPALLQEAASELDLLEKDMAAVNMPIPFITA